MARAWEPDAAYMEWAKLEGGARYNLASSGVANLPMAELPVALADLELGSPSPYGHEPLLVALGRHLGVEPASVVLAAGTSMANHLVMAALVEAGDEVLIESPGYPLLAAVARYLGADVVRFPRRPEDGFRLDPEAVAARLSPRTRLVVMTSLHNPSGVPADGAALVAIGRLADGVGARVLVDEAYREAVFDDTPPSAFHLGPPYVATGSLTKVYGLGGLRLGWILAEAGLALTLRRLGDLFTVNLVHPAERLALAALEHGDRLRDRARRLLAGNRPALDRFLDGRDDLEAVRTRWGTTCFPRLRQGRVEDLEKLLRGEYETSVVPGRFFGAADHFRIGIAGETAEVHEGLRRLGRALDRLRSP